MKSPYSLIGSEQINLPYPVPAATSFKRETSLARLSSRILSAGRTHALLARDLQVHERERVETLAAIELEVSSTPQDASKRSSKTSACLHLGTSRRQSSLYEPLKIVDHGQFSFEILEIVLKKRESLQVRLEP